jgi:hypothetical protein
MWSSLVCSLGLHGALVMGVIDTLESVLYHISVEPSVGACMY